MRPLWAWAILAPLGIIGNAQTLAGLLPTAVGRKLSAMIALPQWDLETWAIALLSAALVILFEGSFRIARGLRDEVKGAESVVETYREGISSMSGDVAVEDVFYWINPCLYEEEAWEEIGADLVDKLHLGQLRAYGRALKDGRPGVLTEIPRHQWEWLTFSYLFFMPDAGNAPHTYHRGNGTEFTDLRFNDAQIEAFWPIPSRPAAKWWRP